MTTTMTTQACPQCGEEMPVLPGYITWCDRCNWNLIPQREQKPNSVLLNLSEKLGLWQSTFLLNRLLHTKDVSRHFFLTPILAYGAIGIGFLFPIVVAIIGLWLIYYAVAVLAIPLNFVGVLVGLAFLLMAWETRPRIHPLPATIYPERYPQLHQLVTQITNALKLPAIYGIVPTASFDAYVGEYTWQRRRVLFLGLPLWDVLEHQERIALLATALARSNSSKDGRAYTLWAVIYNILLIAVYLIPVLLTILIGLIWGKFITALLIFLAGVIGLGCLPLFMYILLAMDLQRTTYLAHYQGAVLSGTEAQIGLVQKMYLVNNWQNALHRYAMDRTNRDKSFFMTIRQEITQIHPRELERLKRATEFELTRLDTFYPPLQQLIMFLWQHFIETPQLKVHLFRWQQIDKEVARLEEDLQEEIAINLWGV